MLLSSETVVRNSSRLATICNRTQSQVAPGSVGTVQIANGAVGSAQLASNLAVTGTFTGNGAALTNLPAGAITGGLTTNFAVLVPGGGTNLPCFTNGILRAIQ